MNKNNWNFKVFVVGTFLQATVGCTSAALVSAPSDFPQNSTGRENVNSKYNSDEFSQNIMTNKIQGEITNASGITFLPKENKFFVITNNNNELHVFDSGEGHFDQAAQTIFLKGWSESGIKNDQDLEDIVYLGENDRGVSEFALVNEGNPGAGAEIYICAIQSTWTELKRQDCLRIHVEIPIAKNNKGIEGLAYDPEQKIFFAVVEGNEKGKDLSVTRFDRPEISRFTTDKTGTKGVAQVVAQSLFDSEKLIARLCPDLSSIVYSAKNQRLYLLSHIGERAIDIDLNGTIQGLFPLKPGLQFEGITLDADDNLLFISEPNLLFKFPRSP